MTRGIICYSNPKTWSAAFLLSGSIKNSYKKRIHIFLQKRGIILVKLITLKFYRLNTRQFRFYARFFIRHNLNGIIGMCEHSHHILKSTKQFYNPSASKIYQFSKLRFLQLKSLYLKNSGKSQEFFFSNQSNAKTTSFLAGVLESRKKE